MPGYASRAAHLCKEPFANARVVYALSEWLVVVYPIEPSGVGFAGFVSGVPQEDGEAPEDGLGSAWGRLYSSGTGVCYLGAAVCNLGFQRETKRKTEAILEPLHFDRTSKPM